MAIAASAALAARDGLRAEKQVRAGRTAFRSLVRDGFSSTSDLRSQAAKGAALFEAGAARARSSGWIRAWARVPVIGQPARWVLGATEASAELARRASRVVAKVEPQLKRVNDPAQRLRFLDTLSAGFGHLRVAVDAVDIPSPGWFLPPVNAADRELRSELARLRSAVDDGEAASRGLRSLLGGPTTYLVLAANNAEMRAGGMILQVGQVRTSDGRMQAGRFFSTGELALKRPVKLPTEINTLYGWLHPDVEWRNVGSSPNFPATAPIYAAMAARKRLGPVDGVLQIDVLGVRALLGVLGPVDVAGRHYTSKNVEQLVLHDLYAEFGSAQIERRHEFSQLAAATFQALNTRHWRPTDIARVLRKAARGRHLIAWSRRPVEQHAWRRMNMDGSLGRDGLMLTVQNHAGNKLDWFLRPSMRLKVDPGLRGSRTMTLTIDIKNPTPPQESRYVAGDGQIVPVGDYRALVAVYLPGWATDVRMPGRSVALVGPDGRSRVIGTRVDVARGRTVTLEIVFTAPASAKRLILLPSGRAQPIPARLGRQPVDDEIPRTLLF